MQRLLDKWGLWIALVVVGSIIAFGLISGYLKEDPDAAKGKGAGGAAKSAPAKSLD